MTIGPRAVRRCAAVVALAAVACACSAPANVIADPPAVSASQPAPSHPSSARPSSDQPATSVALPDQPATSAALLSSPTSPSTSPNARVAVETPTPEPSPTPSATAPSAGAIRPVTAAELGASWHSGCPVAPSGLRAVTVPYYGFDGKNHSGTIIVAASIATDVLDIFTQLQQMRFPIRSITPVSAFGADDEKSMEADNSSAFNCRAITGGGGWSNHSFGTAIDINTRENPYISGNTVLPTNALTYTNRRRTDPGMIHADDAVVRLFARHGWTWGGSWSSPKDYQHFER